MAVLLIFHCLFFPFLLLLNFPSFVFIPLFLLPLCFPLLFILLFFSSFAFSFSSSHLLSCALVCVAFYRPVVIYSVSKRTFSPLLSIWWFVHLATADSRTVELVEMTMEETEAKRDRSPSDRAWILRRLLDRVLLRYQLEEERNAEKKGKPVSTTNQKHKNNKNKK